MENCKAPLKEIIENINKWKDTACPWIGTFDTCYNMNELENIMLSERSRIKGQILQYST